MRYIVFVTLFCTGFLFPVYGQKLPFQNFSVDKGLIQSQVVCITQDEQRHLWLGTFGGLDRFDGKTFTHFSKNEGLNSSAVSCIYAAKNGFIWAGTFKGISCYDGYKIINYPVEEKTSSLNFSRITEDANGNIWAFNFRKGLYIFKNNQFVKATLPFENALPIFLFKDFKGQLLANFLNKGVFLYRQNTWQKFDAIPFTDTTEFIAGLITVEKNYYAFTNKKKLIKYIDKVAVAKTTITVPGIRSGAVDDNGNIWVGTSKGVLIYSGKDLSLLANYTAASGLSDNGINYIYKDAEGNMWIGTDGEGLFKFSGGVFAKLDNSNGLPGKVVMGIAKDNAHHIFIGTREGGLVQCNTGDKKITAIDYAAFSKTGINAMTADNHSNIYLGTMDNKLLRYNGNIFKEIFLDKKTSPFINTIVATEDKIWFTTTNGCYYLKNDSSTKIKGIDEIAIGVLPAEKNETLVGTTNGIFLVAEDNTAKKIMLPLLKDIEVRCLCRYNNFVLIGTADEGIYFWNRQSNAVYKCNAANGLFDDQVFSIFADDKNNIWAGTGTGIQKIFFNEKKQSFSVQKFSKADGYENSESNLNAIMQDEHGSIWIGTTSGIFIFSQDSSAKNNAAPYIVIQDAASPAFNDVQITGSVAPWYHFPLSPVLPYSKNNISFTVKGIFLRDPESVAYSYQLAGYDTAFSAPVSQTFFNYQSLEPGKYIFRVKAIAADGKESANIAEYAFVIDTPFYKSKWFLFLIMGALILTGVFIQLFINKAKQRKQQQLELLRYEEQQKIRQRTSEDFHDELGNKLTRISLLADILEKKTGPADKEKTGIIKQIKENVQSLYTGTKDVIWSLSPGSDNFLEILNRINQFGEELFHDTEIHFSFYGLEEVDADLKLPIDYSRNIIMIFKELLNNSLRHSQASVINITVKRTGENEFIITQHDNGTGFNEEHIKKGNGLNNIQRRAERIGAGLASVSNEKEGTLVTVKIKIPSNGG